MASTALVHVPSRKNPGRPVQYVYRPEYATKAVELGAQGLGLTEIAVELEVPSTTVRHWATLIPAFGQALARASDACAAFYLMTAREGMHEVNVSKNGTVMRRLNDRLFVWVAERSAPEHLRQSLEIDIRALIGEVKQEDLPLDQLRRLAAGESPLAVLRPGASIPASEDPPESV